MIKNAFEFMLGCHKNNSESFGKKHCFKQIDLFFVNFW